MSCCPHVCLHVSSLLRIINSFWCAIHVRLVFLYLPRRPFSYLLCLSLLWCSCSVDLIFFFFFVSLQAMYSQDALMGLSMLCSGDGCWWEIICGLCSMVCECLFYFCFVLLFIVCCHLFSLRIQYLGVFAFANESLYLLLWLSANYIFTDMGLSVLFVHPFIVFVLVCCMFCCVAVKTQKQTKIISRKSHHMYQSITKALNVFWTCQ